MLLDLAGVYRAEGRYKNSPYAAEVTISKQGQLYQLQWRSGARTWGGVGVVQDNVLAAALLGAGGNGVIAYEIVAKKDGLVLHGRWAYASDTQVASEILYRIESAAPPPATEIDDSFDSILGEPPPHRFWRPET